MHVQDHARVVPSPDSVQAEERDSDNVVIRWEQPDNHDEITSYEILVEQEDGDIFSYEVDGSVNEFTITGMKASSVLLKIFTIICSVPLLRAAVLRSKIQDSNHHLPSFNTGSLPATTRLIY